MNTMAGLEPCCVDCRSRYPEVDENGVTYSCEDSMECFEFLELCFEEIKEHDQANILALMDAQDAYARYQSAETKARVSSAQRVVDEYRAKTDHIFDAFCDAEHAREREQMKPRQITLRQKLDDEWTGRIEQ